MDAITGRLICEDAIFEIHNFYEVEFGGTLGLELTRVPDS